jgi:hypothetical protein
MPIQHYTCLIQVTHVTGLVNFYDKYIRFGTDLELVIQTDDRLSGKG